MCSRDKDSTRTPFLSGAPCALMAEWGPIILKLASLGALIVVAGAFRVEGLERRLVDNDECFTWRICRYSVSESMGRLTRDVHPPFHYLMCKGLSVCGGDSLWSLRSLSVFLGLLSIVLYCQLSDEVLFTGTKRSNRWLNGSWWLVGGLATFSVGQISAGSSARMYALGLVGAALSAWTLWRALNSESQFSRWWVAYGLACAAFCYTHYFSFFAVFGQGIFVLGFCVVKSTFGASTKAIRTAAGWLCAVMIAAILYFPWIPAFVGQERDVEESWWVPPVTESLVGDIGFQWLTGAEKPAGIATTAWLALLGTLIGWTLLRGGGAAWFFFTQAFVPWLGVIAVYDICEISLLRLHYFVFAQASLFGFWGVSWRVLRGWPERFLLLLVLAVPFFWELAEYRSQLPNGAPAVAHCAVFLKEYYKEGDWFILDDHRKVNLFRYYTSSAGLPWLSVKCDLSALQKGHIVHLASLDESEICWSEDRLWTDAPGRIWMVNNTASFATKRAPGTKLVMQKAFEGEGGTSCTLSLYDRE